jgi:nucleoside-diphosphate-sugar epimerase
MHRRPNEVAQRDSRWEWVQGDAMQAQDVLRTAEGASVIVHAVNPPSYLNWQGTVLPMVRNTIAAANANRARIVLPGTVYNYGADAFPVLTEDSPQNPVTRKGKLRVALERELQEASYDDAKVLIVRAGDFFAPGATANSWFGAGLVTHKQAVRSVTYPGNKGVGHQWAYVPDVAETMVRLLERDADLPDFASYHMQGHWDSDGRQMVEAIARVTGQPGLKVKSFPWWVMPVLALFNETLRELLEMRYLWKHSIRMDNSKLRAILGEEPHTDLDTAIRATLLDMGCLPNKASTLAVAGI